MVHDTVFSPAFGNRPSQLVGRSSVLREFDGALQSPPGDRRRASLILGQRGSGKTVLLLEMMDRARDAGFVVAAPTVATEDMLDRIIEKIQDDGARLAKNRKTYLSGASIGALGFSAGLQLTREERETQSFQYKLSHLCERINGAEKGVLVLVDEVQANDPNVRKLVAAYQELVGERRDIVLVMAGLPAAISSVLNDRVLTFLNRANKIELGPLSVNDVDAFFVEAFEKLGISIDENVRRRASSLTEGSPYMLQLLGHNLVEYARSGMVGETVLQRAFEASRQEFENDICRTTLSGVSDKDEEFLRAMAFLGTPSSISAIAHVMNVTQDYAQKYRKRLIDAGIIEAARRGYVQFAVPYLSEYLTR